MRGVQTLDPLNFAIAFLTNELKKSSYSSEKKFTSKIKIPSHIFIYMKEQNLIK